MVAPHIAPRHRAPRSLKRTAGRFAGGVAGVVSGRGSRVVAALGVAGMAVSVGAGTVSDGATQHVATHHTAAARPHVGAALASRLAAGRHEVSRSAARPMLTKTLRAPKTKASSQAVSGAADPTVVPAEPRDVARSLLAGYGWSAAEYDCLDELWLHESAWNLSAQNPTSGAYGIPQALPADKMAAYGADWRTNPATQISWGLGYIKNSYGTPCGAWSFWQSHNYY